MKTLILLLAAAALAVPAGAEPAAPAEGSAGATYTGGSGYRGYELRGSVALDLNAAWSLRASFAHSDATVPLESRTNQGTFGVDHAVDERAEARGSLTASREFVSGVRCFGASGGLSYRLDSGAPKASEASLSLDADAFFYSTEASADERVVHGAGGRTLILPASTSVVDLTQFHPTMAFERSFLAGRFRTSASVGYSFYSQEPAKIEALAGRPRLSASAGSLNALVGGFFRQTGKLALSVSLPADVRLLGALGAARFATDGSWALTQELEASFVRWENWKPKLGWARILEHGLRQDLLSVGLTYSL